MPADRRRIGKESIERDKGGDGGKDREQRVYF
jgi:hypothetical protein